MPSIIEDKAPIGVSSGPLTCLPFAPTLDTLSCTHMKMLN